MRRIVLTLAVICLLAGCQGRNQPGDKPVTSNRPAPAHGDSTATPQNEANTESFKTPGDQSPTGPEQETPVQKLRDDIIELQARPEQQADEIQVQHLLIAHKDAGIPGVTRSMQEAETLAAEIWQQVKDGADFDALIRKHTNDSPPGIYGMTASGSGDRNKNIFPRTGMVPAFGDVGWRLKVGEFGVAPYDRVKSRYGWHIIKRLK